MITDYEYERYFYTGSHRKCLLFVEQDCNVAISAGKPPVVTKAEGTPLIITNENILKERFELQENFNSSENWAFGSVEPSVISIDIREDGTIPLLENKTFRLYLYFDGNSSTMMYVGTYVFDEDELSDDSKSRTISGYDFAQTIRDIDIIDFYRGLFNAHEEPDPEDPEQTIWVPAREKITVKEARDKFFEYLADAEKGEGLPIIQEEVELPNDDFEFAFDVDTEALSGGQFIEDICEINGRYGHFGRQLSTATATKNYAIFQYIRVERYDEAGTKIGNDMRMNGVMKGLYETASIGRLRVYNRDSVLIGYYDDGYKKKMSKYNIYDNILIDDLTKSKTTKAALKQMLMNIYDSIRYRKYVPFKIKAPADLCREVGDRITIYTDVDVATEEGNAKSFKTLIFTRKISGIQNMVDSYSAQGDKKIPEFGDYASSSGYSSKSGKSGTSKEQEGSDGELISEYLNKEIFVEIVRNMNVRFPNEPSNVSVEYVKSDGGVAHHVDIKWTDPADISTTEPRASEWAGTIIIRKEDSSPRNIYDGVVVKDSTTRDQYASNAFSDTNIEPNKIYYYGIFPYDTEGYVRFTKIVRIDTETIIPKPEITKLTLEDPGDKTRVNVKYKIESLDSGTYTSSKLAIKKNSIPENIEDADLSMNIPAQSGTYSVGGLDELTRYCFMIFVEDSNGNKASSDPEYITTGEIVAPFREEVVVEKKTGDDEYALVYTWTGKWGKQDDAIVEGFEVSTFDVLLEESQIIENFEESYAENNWISEAQDAEIQT